MGQLTLLGAGKPPAAAAALAFDATDARVNESVGFVATCTFLTCAIGTASAGREVVVGAGGYLGGGSGTITAVTVNGVSLTERKNNGDTANPAGIWSGNVASGTSVTIVVTTSATFQTCCISVGYFNNAVTAGTGQSGYYPGSQNSPYPVTSAITVASGGVGVGFMWNGIEAAGAWGNLTNDADGQATGASNRVIMGQTTTPGSITPSATAGNFKVVSIIAVPFA